MELFAAQQIYDVFAYYRLSKEDGDKVESDSIQNQRELIRNFIDGRPELRFCIDAADDGYTGTNFERPGMQKLLSAVKEKKVNCVIVKDLSRFGREYIETGKYIERLFPFLGVRFIAINDGYDSATADASASLMLPFKNLINDSYCRDTSIKIRSHFDVKRKRGDFIGSFAPFGYAKATDNKNKLVVDESAAEIVREIYALRISGMSTQKISDRLNEQGILSPMEYKRAQGLHFESGYQTNSKAKWSAAAVGRILKNALYTGVLEQGKRTTPNYKVKTVVERPEAEWFRVENAHEALVSAADFALVNALTLTDTRTAPKTDAVYPLAGLLCCGDCNGNMARKNTIADGKTYYYYVCAAHRADTKVCSTHSISEPALEAAVLSGINFHIHAVSNLQAALEAIAERPAQKITVGRIDRQIKALTAELLQKQELKDALYRRYALGEIEQDDFKEFKRIFTQDCEEVEASIALRRRELDSILNSGSPESAWISYYRAFGEVGELTRAIAVKLIDRIHIYAKDRVEIKFKYQGEFNLAAEFVTEQSREEQLREVV